MTTARRYGDDTPFGAWVRCQKGLDSHQYGLTLNDADWIFHRYRLNSDSIGTREVQCMMLVEVKTRGSVPNSSQHETLFFLHQMLTHRGNMRRPGRPGVAVWSYGARVLSMNGTNPVDSTQVRWGSFSDRGQLGWRSIASQQQLIDLLGFNIDPDTFGRIVPRRHHKDTLVEICEDRGLFKVPVTIVKRS